MPNRHFVDRPTLKQRFEEVATDSPMEATYAIHGPAAANREIRHVEVLRKILRIPAAEGQQIVKRDAELLFRVAA